MLDDAHATQPDCVIESKTESIGIILLASQSRFHDECSWNGVAVIVLS